MNADKRRFSFCFLLVCSPFAFICVHRRIKFFLLNRNDSETTYISVNQTCFFSRVRAEVGSRTTLDVLDATNGLALEGIFKAIAREETDEEVVKDCRFIMKNIEMLGMDLLTAINDLIKRSPKGPYSEMLEGAVITVQSGGDLKEYFLATAKVQLEEKKMSLKKSTESLGVMAEMYTILLIVFPLMSVIMLSIMAIMSPDLAGLDLITLMNLLTYVLVPFFGVLILFIMDTMVPKR